MRMHKPTFRTLLSKTIRGRKNINIAQNYPRTQTTPTFLSLLSKTIRRQNNGYILVVIAQNYLLDISVLKQSC